MNLETEVRTKLKKITALKHGVELSEQAIMQRIDSLAQELIDAYPNACPVLIGLMDGALPFASKLHDALAQKNYSFQFTTMQVSSYGEGMRSGELKIDSAPKIAIGGRVVLIVDDVCDTGKTFAKTKELFVQQGAEEVHLMALIDKVQPRLATCESTFTGFKISADKFIVGFGLDYANLLRNELTIKAVNTDFLPSTAEQHVLDEEKVLHKKLTELCSNKMRPAAERNFFNSSHDLLDTQWEEHDEEHAKKKIKLSK